MRFLVSLIVLIACVLLGHETMTGTLPQNTATPNASWTDSTPLTGRAILCDSGRIKSFQCQNIELLSYLPRSAIGGAGGVDLWGWIDSTTGREFVIVGGDSGTAFIEVTDPVNPKYLGFLSLHLLLYPDGKTKTIVKGLAQGVKVYKNHAFITFEAIRNGMQVFDLTQLRDVKDQPAVFQETAHYGNFANAHTITMNQASGFAYPTGITSGGETCGGGLHMIDVRTPTVPVFAGCYTNRESSLPYSLFGLAYVHDAQCVLYQGPDKQYKGREICINSSQAAVVIADVTNKQQPKTISIARYPDVGYAHQGWLTEDQRYFFLNDEFDEATMAERVGVDKTKTRTIVFDFSDLDDPVVLTEYYATTANTDHNLYIRGRYMYQANYGAGLRIIDIADPKAPKEVGHLSQIGNAWTNYPYFKKDVVAVSTDKGLYLARLRVP